MERLLQHLKDAIDLFGFVFNSITQAINVTDLDGLVIFANREVVSLFGEAAPDHGLFLPDQSTPWPADQLPAVRVVRSGHTSFGLMFVRNHQRPEGCWVMASASPLKRSDGQLMGAVVIYKEIIQAAEGLPSLGVNVPAVPL